MMPLEVAIPNLFMLTPPPTDHVLPVSDRACVDVKLIAGSFLMFKSR